MLIGAAPKWVKQIYLFTVYYYYLFINLCGRTFKLSLVGCGPFAASEKKQEQSFAVEQPGRTTTTQRHGCGGCGANLHRVHIVAHLVEQSFTSQCWRSLAGWLASLWQQRAQLITRRTHSKHKHTHRQTQATATTCCVCFSLEKLAAANEWHPLASQATGRSSSSCSCTVWDMTLSAAR